MSTVSGDFGQCTETKSTLGRIALRSVTFLDLGLGDVRVEHEDVHLEGDATLHGARADAAHADHQDRFARQVGRQVGKALAPAVLTHEAVVLLHQARRGEQHVHRMLSDRNRVGDSGGHQRDLAFVQRRDLDRIEADAETGHHHHAGCGVELGLAERRGAQSDGVGVLELGMQRGDRVVGKDLEVDVIALPQHLDAGFRHASDDQNFFPVFARAHRFPCREVGAILEPRKARR
jgi:hypothetical protein